MGNRLATKQVMDDLDTLKRGLHIAMDHLINRNDKSEAERVLREVDSRLVSLIASTKLAE